MPTITHENVNELNAVVTIELSKDDYLPKVNKKLKEYRKQAQIKGFRPGKVPMGLIKRKFGTAVLIDEVNDAVAQNLDTYFNENKLNVLGQPMAIESEELKFSINQPKDYTLKFELGLAPEFEVQGISADNLLPFYDIAVEDEEVNQEIDKVRKQYGTGFIPDVTDVDEEDMLAINLVELDENNEVKEGGVEKEETFLALRDVNNAELKDNLLSATISDSFDVDVFTLEDRPADYIKKNVLGIEAEQEVNNMFRLTIKEIKRVEKAEMNEEFFKKLFPNEDITTEEAFREKVQGEIYTGYKQSSLNHYTNLVFDFLMEQNQMDLPVEFLQKWMSSSQENLPENFFEGPEFQQVLKNTRWSLIRNKLAEQYEVNVEYQDVENMTRGEILRYFNYQIPPYGEMMDNMLQKILSDKKEVNRRFEVLMDQKTLEKAAENMGKDMKPSTKEEFEALVEEYQKAKEAANQPAEEVAAE